VADKVGGLGVDGETFLPVVLLEVICAYLTRDAEQMKKEVRASASFSEPAAMDPPLTCRSDARSIQLLASLRAVGRAAETAVSAARAAMTPTGQLDGKRLDLAAAATIHAETVHSLIVSAISIATADAGAIIPAPSTLSTLPTLSGHKRKSRTDTLAATAATTAGCRPTDSSASSLRLPRMIGAAAAAAGVACVTDSIDEVVDNDLDAAVKMRVGTASETSVDGGRKRLRLRLLDRPNN
jgi:hypothetical protein